MVWHHPPPPSINSREYCVYYLGNVSLTSYARGDTICPAPLSPVGALRADEQTQRSSTFPRRIRSHAEQGGMVTLTFDLESGTCPSHV